MATITKLKVGQTVYSVTKAKKRWRSSDPKWDVWPILVTEIDLENKRVKAVCNRTMERWYDEARVKTWRVNDPNRKSQS